MIDTVVDLTSLLDVIFIILFLVMQQNGGILRRAEDEAGALRTALAEREQALQAVTAEAEAANSLLESYELFADTAICVSVTVGTPETAPSAREITVSYTGGEPETIRVTWESMETAERQLRAVLTRITGQAEGVPAFLTFQYDSTAIYRRDYEMIRGVMETLQSENSDIYLKFVEKEHDDP